MNAATSPISPTYDYLIKRYGPLMTLAHVTEVLHGSPTSIRMIIARRHGPLAIELGNARRKFGRRVFFDTRRVAEVIDQETEPTRHSGSRNNGLVG